MFERIPPREWRDLLLAWFAVSIAFSLIFTRQEIDIVKFISIFIISLITVGLGFVLHELAHKFVAMHYGFWAEFRKDNLMLLVAVIMAAVVGVVFAAPGATVIYGTYISREQNGRISAAGPLTNLILCIPFAMFRFLPMVPQPDIFGTPLLPLIGIFGLKVNSMIAVFNMLPISVLDGRKVLSWNPAVFGGLFAISLGVLYVSFLL
jgi:Zn-dependent protease